MVRRMTFRYTNKDTGRLSIGTKLSYGAPMFSLTSLTLLLGVHAPLFYEKMGATLNQIAFYTAMGRSFDVITDPLMGWVTDSTRSRWGRRRPYMLAGCVGYAVCFSLFFSPPYSPTSTISSDGIALWYGVFYILFYLFDTITNVPYTALGPELTDNYDERSSVYFFVRLYQALGSLIGAAGPGILLQLMGNTCDHSSDCRPDCHSAWASISSHVNSSTELLAPINYSLVKLVRDSCTADCIGEKPEMRSMGLCANASLCKNVNPCNRCVVSCELMDSRAGLQGIAIFFGVFYILAILNCTYRIRERPESSQTPPQPLVANLLRTVRNQPFRLLVGAWVIDWVMVSLVGTMLPFWVQYVLCPMGSKCADKHSVWVGVLFLALLTSQLLSMPMWLYLTRKLGKRNTWVLYNLVNACTTVLYVFCGEDQVLLATLFTMANGVPLGGQFLIESILSDVIDYEEFLTGRRIEGAFTVFQTFLPKISSIPAQTIPLAVLAGVGFISSDKGQRKQQPENVKFFIVLLFSAMPCGLALISFVIKLYFPIKTRRAVGQIGEGIAAHHHKQSGYDPVTEEEVRLPEAVDAATGAQLSLLDAFPIDAAETITSEDKPAALAMLARIETRMCLFVAISLSLVGGFLTLVYTALRLKLLDTKGWSWVPTLCMISCGVCLTSVVFNAARVLMVRKIAHLRRQDGLVGHWKEASYAGQEDTPPAGDTMLSKAAQSRAVTQYLEHRRSIEGNTTRRRALRAKRKLSSSATVHPAVSPTEEGSSAGAARVYKVDDGGTSQHEP